MKGLKTSIGDVSTNNRYDVTGHTKREYASLIINNKEIIEVNGSLDGLTTNFRFILAMLQLMRKENQDMFSKLITTIDTIDMRIQSIEDKLSHIEIEIQYDPDNGTKMQELHDNFNQSKILNDK